MKNYFNEEVVKEHLYDYLSETDEYKKNIIFEKHLHKPIQDVVKAIIFTHKYTRFLSFEEAMSVGMTNVWQSLEKFDIDKGKSGRELFNYCSLVAKRSIYFHQIKEYKNKKPVNSLDAMKDAGFDAEDKEDESIFLEDEFMRYMDWLIFYLPVFLVKSNTNIYRKIKGYLEKMRAAGYNIISNMGRRTIHHFLKSNSGADSRSIRNLMRYIDNGYYYYNNGMHYPFNDNSRSKEIFLYKEEDQLYHSVSTLVLKTDITKEEAMKMPLFKENMIKGKTFIRYS